MRRYRRPRTFLAGVLIAGVCGLLILGREPVVTGEVGQVISLPVGGQVAYTPEMLRQGQLAVSFDRNRLIYILDESGWAFYAVSSAGQLKTVRLQKPAGPSQNYRNLSISASRGGSEFWCSAGNFLRVYSSTGALLQEWPIPNIDVGSVHALDGGRAIVDGGGPLYLYRVGHKTSERALVSPTLSGPYRAVTWEGTVWGVSNVNGAGHAVLTSSTFPGSEEKKPEQKVALRSDEPMGAIRPYWSEGNHWYFTATQFSPDPQLHFFRVRGHHVRSGISLRQNGDLKVAALHPKLALKQPLWATPNSVFILALDQPQERAAASASAPIPAKPRTRLLVLQFSSVPRWRSWWG